jgi:hypothetical protein
MGGMMDREDTSMARLMSSFILGLLLVTQLAVAELGR